MGGGGGLADKRHGGRVVGGVSVDVVLVVRLSCTPGRSGGHNICFLLGIALHLSFTLHLLRRGRVRVTGG